jgi:hypothetical protein
MKMADNSFHDIFSEKKLADLFPLDRSNQFFDALYGDAAEGAYDISLVFQGIQNNSLAFEFHLRQRPGRCLACNLTYGLPEVFSRHPVINLNGLFRKIAEQIENKATALKWEIGVTSEVSPALHVVPFTIHLEQHQDK